MSVNDFEYYIACRNLDTKEMEIIATFKHESDRDYALDALEQEYPDYEFEKVDEE